MAARRKPKTKPKAKAKTKTRPAADIAEAAIDAALALALDKGWRNVALADVAARLRVPMSRLYTLYPSKTAILAAFSRRIDAAVLAGKGADAGDSPRDRLFDALMRRFDALGPHKEQLAAILGSLPADPLAALCLAPQLGRSMAWMLEAAGIPSGGAMGAVRVKGLAAIYLCVLRVWLNDATPDLAKTMAALDAQLRRVEPWARSLFRRAAA